MKPSPSRATRRVHARQPPGARAKTAAQRVVAAGIENDEVHGVTGELHFAEDPAGADRLNGHVAFFLDHGGRGHQIVLAVDLKPVTGVEEQPHRIAAGLGQAFTELDDGVFHGLLMGIHHQHHIEFQAAQGGVDKPGVIGRIGQGNIFVGAVADNQGDAGRAAKP